MFPMVVCGLLTVLGLAAILWWSHLDVQAAEEGETDPDQEPDAVPTTADVVRRFLRYLTLAVAAGLGAGVLMAGAGGRLAMRLLAATAGPAAQGKKTEAEEVVGRITTGGTVGFVIFTALFFGVASGALYLLVRRWLPEGRLRGLTYGMLLLVITGPRIDPLRADNPDFGIVGPGWLALAVFSALVLAHGMLVAALAGRYSRALPLVSARPRVLLRYAPLVPLAITGSGLLFVVLGGVLGVAASRSRAVVVAVRSPTALLAGRVALAAIAAISLPGLLNAAVDIARSSS